MRNKSRLFQRFEKFGWYFWNDTIGNPNRERNFIVRVKVNERVVRNSCQSAVLDFERGTRNVLNGRYKQIKSRTFQNRNDESRTENIYDSVSDRVVLSTVFFFFGKVGARFAKTADCEHNARKFMRLVSHPNNISRKPVVLT